MIISNIDQSLEIIDIGGKFISALLVILIIILLLVSGTKYWNRYVSNIFDTCLNPLLLIFLAIVIFKIILIV